MKIQPTILTILFLTGLFSFSQNNDIEKIQAAILSPHNNQTYFFVGKKVYQYDTKTRSRKIRNLGSDAFRGIPTHIDAALVNPITGKAFIFKGNSWYRFNLREGKKERQGILGSDGFKGITGPFNGAVQHGTSGQYAFFKGNKVYIYNPRTSKVQYSGIIGANNVYKGVPTNPDAVVQLDNGKIYFIKGDHYYRYDPKKLRVDVKRVIGRDGFYLFPGVRAAMSNRAFKKDYYWEQYNSNSGSPEVPAESIFEISKARSKKKTKYGYKHYEGIPANVDAVLSHYSRRMPYFLKGSKYYRYNPKTRKVDQSGEIKTGWGGLPGNVNAAYSSNDGYHYFFKGERWYAYSYNTKKLRNPSGSFIKTGFKGVPNYLDAAIYAGDKIYFYKKNTEYVFDRRKRKVVAKNSIAKIAE